MNEKKAKPDFDKIVKVILLAMIALCLIALVVTARKPGGTGASAGGPPGMAGAPRAAATGAAGAGPVITSYSIHYTKLYEIMGSRGLFSRSR